MRYFVYLLCIISQPRSFSEALTNSPWIIYYHEGRPYYYNKETGESTWDLPNKQSENELNREKYGNVTVDSWRYSKGEERNDTFSIQNHSSSSEVALDFEQTIFSNEAFEAMSAPDDQSYKAEYEQLQSDYNASLSVKQKLEKQILNFEKNIMELEEMYSGKVIENRKLKSDILNLNDLNSELIDEIKKSERQVNLALLNTKLANEKAESYRIHVSRLEERLKNALKEIQVLEEAIDKYVNSSPQTTPGSPNEEEKDEIYTKNWSYLKGRSLFSFLKRKESPIETLIEGFAKNYTSIVKTNRDLREEIDMKHKNENKLAERIRKLEQNAKQKEHSYRCLKKSVDDLMVEIEDKEQEVADVAIAYATIEEEKNLMGNKLDDCMRQLLALKDENKSQKEEIERIRASCNEYKNEAKKAKELSSNIKNEHKKMIENKSFVEAKGNEKSGGTNERSSTDPSASGEADKNDQWERMFMYM